MNATLKILEHLKRQQANQSEQTPSEHASAEQATGPSKQCTCKCDEQSTDE